MPFDVGAVLAEAESFGFTSVGELNTGAMIFDPSVRDMCTPENCNKYDHSWKCPTACESVEVLAERARQYPYGVIVQTTAELEDDFDFETMGGTYEKHEKNFAAWIACLRAEGVDILPLGADTCGICKECTYPGAPCRCPELAVSPAEAYGLVVSQLCQVSGMKYNYGRGTITYTGFCLIK